MKRLSLFVAVLSLAVFAGTAQANLLDDGSLELGTDGTQITNSAWTITSNFDPAAGIISASAWAAKDGTNGLWYQSFNGGAGNACGAAGCDLNLSQSVVAPANGNYTLTFWSARETNHLATSDIVSLSSSGTGGTDSIDLFTAAFNDALNFADGGGTQFTLSLTGVTAGDTLTVEADLLGGLSNLGASESLMLDLFSVSAVGLSTQTATLIAPGMSVWTDPMAWSTDPLFPNNGNGGFDYDVVIDNGGVVDVPIMTSIIVDTVALDDGSIDVNGSLTAQFGLTNASGGTITGDGTIAGLVTNNGRVSPGGLGTFATLQIDDDYDQQSGGVLEIEVGNMLPPPGLLHDQLNVTGTAMLAGRLELPIVFPFTPLDPTQDNEIILLTAAAVVGRFDSLFSPNLGDVMPPDPEVAVEILYNPGMPGGLPGDVRARFVMPTPGGPLAATGPVTDWSAPGTFTMPPDSTQIIELSNVGPAFQPQRVNVQTANAFVHRLIVVGTSSLDTMTIAVSNGQSLSATAGVIVGQNAAVELGSELPDGTTTTGNLASARIDINSGGRLVGIGTVVGNLNVGTDSGPEPASLSPGFSVGHLEVDGNYQQGENGALTIDVNGTTSGEFDTINVTGNAGLGGSLTFDATNFTAVSGTFEFLTAGSGEPPGEMLENTFQNVQTVGNDDIYVALSIGGLTDVAGGASSGGGNYNVNGEICPIGDMDCSGVVNMDDVPLFARALRTPNSYHIYTWNTFDPKIMIHANDAGDVDGLNDGLDFDDVDDFADMVAAGSGASVGFVLAAIESALSGVPEPSAATLLIVGAWILCDVRSLRRRRRERRYGNSHSLYGG